MLSSTQLESEIVNWIQAVWTNLKRELSAEGRHTG